MERFYVLQHPPAPLTASVAPVVAFLPRNIECVRTPVCLNAYNSSHAHAQTAQSSGRHIKPDGMSGFKMFQIAHGCARSDGNI